MGLVNIPEIRSPQIDLGSEVYVCNERILRIQQESSLRFSKSPNRKM